LINVYLCLFKIRLRPTPEDPQSHSHVRRNAEGNEKEVGGGHVKKGVYSHFTPEGQTLIIHWTADENVSHSPALIADSY
jgi:hypothetical protein